MIRKARRVLLALAAAGAILALGRLGAAHILTVLDAVAAWGPLPFGAVYAASVVFGVPGSALTVAAGAALGPGSGFLAASLGSTTGAALAFLIARHALRGRVEAWAGRHPGFDRLDEAAGRLGWRMVALSRLSPLLPFSVLNYGWGVTRVPFGQYLAASWVAMAPGTALYVYVGWMGRSSLDALGGDVSTAQFALQGVGLVASAVVAVLVTRAGRAAWAAPGKTAEALAGREAAWPSAPSSGT